ncbi:replication initiator protein [Microviridae sp.]|nr:replication initiator protein [Microviridae sp.]
MGFFPVWENVQVPVNTMVVMSAAGSACSAKNSNPPPGRVEFCWKISTPTSQVPLLHSPTTRNIYPFLRVLNLPIYDYLLIAFATTTVRTTTRISAILRSRNTVVKTSDRTIILSPSEPRPSGLNGMCPGYGVKGSLTSALLPANPRHTWPTTLLKNAFGAPPEWSEWHVPRVWRKGFIDVGTVTSKSASYVAHYATKKIEQNLPTEERFFHYLPGYRPEFIRMSRKPPIGMAGAAHILKLMQTRAGQLSLETHGVPHSFEYDGRHWPFGRYIREWLHNELGVEQEERLNDYTRYTDLPLINPYRAKKAREREAADLRKYRERSKRRTL